MTTTNSNANESKKQTVNDPNKFLVKKLNINEEFKCRAEELYNIFTDINASLNFSFKTKDNQNHN